MLLSNGERMKKLAATFFPDTIIPLFHTLIRPQKSIWSMHTIFLHSIRRLNARDLIYMQ